MTRRPELLLALLLGACASPKQVTTPVESQPAAPDAGSPDAVVAVVTGPDAAMDLEAECQGGNGDACVVLASELLDGRSRPKSIVSAMKVLEHGCELSHAPSCGFIGLIYVEGLAAPEIPYRPDVRRKGIPFREKACTLKEAKSCWHLGTYYRSASDLVRLDEGKAKRYFKQACDLGHESACDE
jgi:uncharacterized protein